MANIGLTLTYTSTGDIAVNSGDSISISYLDGTVNYPEYGVYNNATITNLIFETSSDPVGYDFDITLVPADAPGETITGVVTSTGTWDAPPNAWTPWTLTENIQVSFNYDAPVYGCTDSDACNYDGSATVDDDSCLDWVNWYCDEDCDGKGCGSPEATCVDAPEALGECGVYDDGLCPAWVLTGDDPECECDQDYYDCAGVCGGDNICGCTDGGACNYNPDATHDDESCDDGPEENYDCDGNCIVDIDCNGDCGGSAEVDECGNCDGPGYVCGSSADGGDCPWSPCNHTINTRACNYQVAGACYDCQWPTADENCEDENAACDAWNNTHWGNYNCDGSCGGNFNSEEDCAGVCNGDSVEDCAGDCGGSATEDCVGICGGDNVEDECGVCGGGYPDYLVCAGNVNQSWGCINFGFFVSFSNCYNNVNCTDGGNNTGDDYICKPRCNIDEDMSIHDDCYNGNEWSTCEYPCDCDNNVADCAGECGGSTEFDECGVCGGDGSTCLPGCTDPTACNYNPDAVEGYDDGSCELPDECGVCEGESTGPGETVNCCGGETACTEYDEGYSFCPTHEDGCFQCGGSCTTAGYDGATCRCCSDSDCGEPFPTCINEGTPESVCECTIEGGDDGCNCGVSNPDGCGCGSDGETDCGCTITGELGDNVWECDPNNCPPDADSDGICDTADECIGDWVNCWDDYDEECGGEGCNVTGGDEPWLQHSDNCWTPHNPEGTADGCTCSDDPTYETDDCGNCNGPGMEGDGGTCNYVMCWTLECACTEEECPPLLNCAGTSPLCCAADMDCNGDCFGGAQLNTCGVCWGGNTGNFEGDGLDCNGDCFGTAVVDECGDCGGDNLDEFGCDCGGNSLDECGICDGDGVCGCGNLTETCDCCYDCDGNYGGFCDTDGDGTHDSADDCIDITGCGCDENGNIQKVECWEGSNECPENCPSGEPCDGIIGCNGLCYGLSTGYDNIIGPDQITFLPGEARYDYCGDCGGPNEDGTDMSEGCDDCCRQYDEDSCDDVQACVDIDEVDTDCNLICIDADDGFCVDGVCNGGSSTECTNCTGEFYVWDGPLLPQTCEWDGDEEECLFMRKGGIIPKM